MKFRYGAFFGNLVSGILTGNVRWELPGKSGTLALTADIDSAVGLNAAWTTATLVNGFSMTGLGFESLRYRLRNKTVELQGACTRNTGNSGETTVFTLPPGMRPSGRIVLPSPGYFAATANDFRVDVAPDGRVLLVGTVASGPNIGVVLCCTFGI